MELLDSFLSLLNMAVASRAGTLYAAAALTFVVWLVQKVPFVKDFVDSNPKLESVVTLFLAVAPAVVTTLTTSTSWTDALATAVMTFLMAVGAKTATDKMLA